MAKKSIVIRQKREPKFSTRAYTRCRICGRPHSVLRKYGICRICFRELAYKGEIPGVRKYVAVDGGMFDNPRYALYQAKYTPVLAARANEEGTETVSVAGKCCESGDLVCADVRLPAAKPGDLLAVLSTGAYNYSMAMNYNRNLIPPCVLVREGKAAYIVRPQSYADLTRNDAVPEYLRKKDAKSGKE